MLSLRFPVLPLCTALAFAWGCGDSSSAPGLTPDAIPLTVFVPGARGSDDLVTFAELQYQVACDADPGEEPPVQRATLDARDAVHGRTDRPVDVWLASVEVEPGECVVAFVGLDENGEQLCTGSYGVTVTEDTSALYYDMDCLHSDATTELQVSAATPVELEAAVSVHYALRLAELPGPPAVVAEGTLERQWLGTADLGQGLVATFIWGTSVGTLDWVHYDLELTAVDEEGTPLCRADTRIELIWNIVNKVHVVIPCSS